MQNLNGLFNGGTNFDNLTNDDITLLVAEQRDIDASAQLYSGAQNGEFFYNDETRQYYKDKEMKELVYTVGDFTRIATEDIEIKNDALSSLKAAYENEDPGEFYNEQLGYFRKIISDKNFSGNIGDIQKLSASETITQKQADTFNAIVDSYTRKYLPQLGAALVSSIEDDVKYNSKFIADNLNGGAADYTIVNDDGSTSTVKAVVSGDGTHITNNDRENFRVIYNSHESKRIGSAIDRIRKYCSSNGGSDDVANAAIAYALGGISEREKEAFRNKYPGIAKAADEITFEEVNVGVRFDIEKPTKNAVSEQIGTKDFWQTYQSLDPNIPSQISAGDSVRVPVPFEEFLAQQKEEAKNKKTLAQSVWSDFGATTSFIARAKEQMKQFGSGKGGTPEDYKGLGKKGFGAGFRETVTDLGNIPVLGIIIDAGAAAGVESAAIRYSEYTKWKNSDPESYNGKPGDPYLRLLNNEKIKGLKKEDQINEIEKIRSFDKELMDALKEAQMAAIVRGENKLAYTIGQITTGSLSFMAEIATTRGAAGAVKSSFRSTMKGVAKNKLTASERLGRTVERARIARSKAYDVAAAKGLKGVDVKTFVDRRTSRYFALNQRLAFDEFKTFALEAAPLIPLRGVSTGLEIKMQSNIGVGVNSDGGLDVTYEHNKNILDALIQGVATTATEVLSEGMGSLASASLGRGLYATSKIPYIGRAANTAAAPVKIASKVARAIYSKLPASTRRVLSKAGYNGYLEEIGEEFINDTMNAAMGFDDDAPIYERLMNVFDYSHEDNLNKWASMAISFAITPTVVAGMNAPAVMQENRWIRNAEKMAKAYRARTPDFKGSDQDAIAEYLVDETIKKNKDIRVVSNEEYEKILDEEKEIPENVYTREDLKQKVTADFLRARFGSETFDGDVTSADVIRHGYELYAWEKTKADNPDKSGLELEMLFNKERAEEQLKPFLGDSYQIDDESNEFNKIEEAKKIIEDIALTSSPSTQKRRLQDLRRSGLVYYIRKQTEEALAKQKTEADTASKEEQTATPTETVDSEEQTSYRSMPVNMFYNATQREIEAELQKFKNGKYRIYYTNFRVETDGLGRKKFKIKGRPVSVNKVARGIVKGVIKRKERIERDAENILSIINDIETMDVGTQQVVEGQVRQEKINEGAVDGLVDNKEFSTNETSPALPDVNSVVSGVADAAEVTQKKINEAAALAETISAAKAEYKTKITPSPNRSIEEQIEIIKDLEGLYFDAKEVDKKYLTEDQQTVIAVLESVFREITGDKRHEIVVVSGIEKYANGFTGGGKNVYISSLLLDFVISHGDMDGFVWVTGHEWFHSLVSRKETRGVARALMRIVFRRMKTDKELQKKYEAAVNVYKDKKGYKEDGEQKFKNRVLEEVTADEIGYWFADRVSLIRNIKNNKAALSDAEKFIGEVTDKLNLEPEQNISKHLKEYRDGLIDLKKMIGYAVTSRFSKAKNMEEVKPVGQEVVAQAQSAQTPPAQAVTPETTTPEAKTEPNVSPTQEQKEETQPEQKEEKKEAVQEPAKQEEKAEQTEENTPPAVNETQDQIEVNALLLENIGDLFSAMGDKEKAQHYWEQALQSNTAINPDAIKKKIAKVSAVKETAPKKTDTDGKKSDKVQPPTASETQVKADTETESKTEEKVSAEKTEPPAVEQAQPDSTQKKETQKQEKQKVNKEQPAPENTQEEQEAQDTASEYSDKDLTNKSAIVTLLSTRSDAQKEEILKELKSFDGDFIEVDRNMMAFGRASVLNAVESALQDYMNGIIPINIVVYRQENNKKKRHAFTGESGNYIYINEKEFDNEWLAMICTGHEWFHALRRNKKTKHLAEKIIKRVKDIAEKANENDYITKRLEQLKDLYKDKKTLGNEAFTTIIYEEFAANEVGRWFVNTKDLKRNMLQIRNNNELLNKLGSFVSNIEDGIEKTDKNSAFVDEYIMHIRSIQNAVEELFDYIVLTNEERAAAKEARKTVINPDNIVNEAVNELTKNMKEVEAGRDSRGWVGLVSAIDNYFYEISSLISSDTLSSAINKTIQNVKESENWKKSLMSLYYNRRWNKIFSSDNATISKAAAFLSENSTWKPLFDAIEGDKEAIRRFIAAIIVEDYKHIAPKQDVVEESKPEEDATSNEFQETFSIPQSLMDTEGKVIADRYSDVLKGYAEFMFDVMYGRDINVVVDAMYGFAHTSNYHGKDMGMIIEICKELISVGYYDALPILVALRNNKFKNTNTKNSSIVSNDKKEEISAILTEAINAAKDKKHKPKMSRLAKNRFKEEMLLLYSENKEAGKKEIDSITRNLITPKQEDETIAINAVKKYTAQKFGVEKLEGKPEYKESSKENMFRNVRTAILYGDAETFRDQILSAISIQENINHMSFVGRRVGRDFDAGKLASFVVTRNIYPFFAKQSIESEKEYSSRVIKLIVALANKVLEKEVRTDMYSLDAPISGRGGDDFASLLDTIADESADTINDVAESMGENIESLYTKNNSVTQEYIAIKRVILNTIKGIANNLQKSEPEKWKKYSKYLSAAYMKAFDLSPDSIEKMFASNKTTLPKFIKSFINKSVFVDTVLGTVINNIYSKSGYDFNTISKMFKDEFKKIYQKAHVEKNKEAFDKLQDAFESIGTANAIRAIRSKKRKTTLKDIANPEEKQKITNSIIGALDRLSEKYEYKNILPDDRVIEVVASNENGERVWGIRGKEDKDPAGQFSSADIAKEIIAGIEADRTRDAETEKEKRVERRKRNSAENKAKKLQEEFLENATISQDKQRNFTVLYKDGSATASGTVYNIDENKIYVYQLLPGETYKYDEFLHQNLIDYTTTKGAIQKEDAISTGVETTRYKKGDEVLVELEDGETVSVIFLGYARTDKRMVKVEKAKGGQFWINTSQIVGYADKAVATAKIKNSNELERRKENKDKSPQSIDAPQTVEHETGGDTPATRKPWQKKLYTNKPAINQREIERRVSYIRLSVPEIYTVGKPKLEKYIESYDDSNAFGLESVVEVVGVKGYIGRSGLINTDLIVNTAKPYATVLFDGKAIPEDTEGYEWIVYAAEEYKKDKSKWSVDYLVNDVIEVEGIDYKGFGAESGEEFLKHLKVSVNPSYVIATAVGNDIFLKGLEHDDAKLHVLRRIDLYNNKYREFSKASIRAAKKAVEATRSKEELDSLIYQEVPIDNNTFFADENNARVVVKNPNIPMNKSGIPYEIRNRIWGNLYDKFKPNDFESKDEFIKELDSYSLFEAYARVADVVDPQNGDPYKTSEAFYDAGILGYFNTETDSVSRTVISFSIEGVKKDYDESIKTTKSFMAGEVYKAAKEGKISIVKESDLVSRDEIETYTFIKSFAEQLGLRAIMYRQPLRIGGVANFSRLNPGYIGINFDHLSIRGVIDTASHEWFHAALRIGGETSRAANDFLNIIRQMIKDGDSDIIDWFDLNNRTYGFKGNEDIAFEEFGARIIGYMMSDEKIATRVLNGVIEKTKEQESDARVLKRIVNMFKHFIDILKKCLKITSKKHSGIYSDLLDSISDYISNLEDALSSAMASSTQEAKLHGFKNFDPESAEVDLLNSMRKSYPQKTPDIHASIDTTHGVSNVDESSSDKYIRLSALTPEQEKAQGEAINEAKRNVTKNKKTLKAIKEALGFVLKPRKGDLSALDLVFSFATQTREKSKVAADVYDAAERYKINKLQMLRDANTVEVNGETVTAMEYFEEIRENNKDLYDRATKYIYDRDEKKDGFTVKKVQDDDGKPLGKRVFYLIPNGYENMSETKKANRKIVFNTPADAMREKRKYPELYEGVMPVGIWEGRRYYIHDGKNNKGMFEEFESEAEALEMVCQLTAKRILEENKGDTDLAKFVNVYQKMMFNGYNILADQLDHFRDIIISHGEDADSTNKEELKDLYQTYSEMGDLIGTYMPRVRVGEYYLVGTDKDGRKVRLPYKNRFAAAADYVILKRQGYRLQPEASSKLATSNLLATSMSNMNNIIHEATNRLKDERKFSFESFGVSVFNENSEETGRMLRFYVKRSNDPSARATYRYFMDYGKDMERKDWSFYIPVENEEDAERIKKNILEGLISVNDAYSSEYKLQSEFIDIMKKMLLERSSRATMLGREDAVGDDVVEGYEKDPIEAAKTYFSGVISGSCRTKFASEYIEAIDGRAYTEDKFRADFPESRNLEKGDFIELYREEAEKHRLRPTEQPNLAKEVNSVYETIMSTPGVLERVSSAINGIAALYFLSRPASAIINLSALATNVPSELSEATGADYDEIMKLIISFSKDYYKYRRERAKGNAMQASGLPIKEALLFEKIIRNQWDNNTLTSQILAKTESTLGKLWTTGQKGLFFLFNETERVSRAASIMTAYTLLSRYGKGRATTEKEIDDILFQAKNLTDRALGNYEKWAQPAAFRGTLGKALSPMMLFTTFVRNMYAENFMRRKMNKHALKFYLIVSLIGGAKTTGITAIAGLIANLIGAIPAGEDPEEYLIKQAALIFGEEGETAYNIADTFMRTGALGFTGIDASGSLNMYDWMMFPTSAEGVAKKYFGAPGSIFMTAANTPKVWEKNKLMAIEGVTPAVVSSVIKAIREHQYGIALRDGEIILDEATGMPIKLGDGRQWYASLEFWQRAFGFNPKRIARYREDMWNTKSRRRSFTETKTDLLNRARLLLANDVPTGTVEWNELLREIDEFNQLVITRKDPHITGITESTLNKVFKEHAESRALKKPEDIKADIEKRIMKRDERLNGFNATDYDYSERHNVGRPAPVFANPLTGKKHRVRINRRKNSTPF